MLRFVVVNDRIPRAATFCALDCEPITETYLREIGTRLCYHGIKCYHDHCKVAVALLEDHSRRAS